MASPDEYGYDDVGLHQQPRRWPTHRYAPYITAHDQWAVSVADTVEKALQRCQQSHRHRHESAAPMVRRRRMLASKVELAAQSAVNMAAYLERRGALLYTPGGSAAALPVERVAEDEEEDGEWTMCCICLEKNRPNDTRRPLKALQCGHVFHRDCIAQWTSYKRCCPVDRLKVAEDA